MKQIKLLWTLGLMISLISGGIMAEELKHNKPAILYDEHVEKVSLSEKEWESLLPHEQFVILRQKGTEKAFSGQYNHFYEKGVYICAACGQPLFHSDAKYDSKSGWPSYYQPLSENSITTKEDRKFLFMVRTEVVCSRCGGHLGHVFDDGPKPTGLRYCINSRALSFIPE